MFRRDRQKERKLPLGPLLGEEYEGAVLVYKLAKARKVARWGYLIQAIQMANQKALTKGRRELDEEGFKAVFSPDPDTPEAEEPDDEPEQPKADEATEQGERRPFAGEALEAMVDFSEDVLTATLVRIEVPNEAPLQGEEAVEALLDLGVGKGFKLAERLSFEHDVGARAGKSSAPSSASPQGTASPVSGG
ncbi:MAG: hypothetical protein AAGJ19_13785 [Myxococcota bacterium]